MNLVKYVQTLLSKIDTKFLVLKFFAILFITIFFISLAMLVYSYIHSTSNNLSTLTNNNKILVETIGHLSYYTILSIGIMLVLVQLGFNLNTILVVLGSVGLAIALALQNSITNIASGFMILFLNYYDIGDLVEISDTMGYIHSFNLFNTTVKNLDNILINIPNSSIVDGTLTNYYKEKIIKLSLEVNVSNYDKTVNIQELLSAIKEALAEKCTFIVDKNEISGNVKDLSKEGTLLKVKFPVENHNYLAAKGMANNIVREVIREKNIFLLDNYYLETKETKNDAKDK